MPDAQTIFIKDHSSQKQIDRAYDVMCAKYSELILEYCIEHQGLLTEIIDCTGCKYPDNVFEFIIRGEGQPTGRDLERLLSYTGLSQRFAEEVQVVIGSEVDYPTVLCGTSVNSGDETTHRDGSEVPERLDRLARLVLSKTDWFYYQASKRYVRQQKSKG